MVDRWTTIQFGEWPCSTYHRPDSGNKFCGDNGTELDRSCGVGTGWFQSVLVINHETPQIRKI